jgi:hypothetical protein
MIRPGSHVSPPSVVRESIVCPAVGSLYFGRVSKRSQTANAKRASSGSAWIEHLSTCDTGELSR